MPYLFIIKGKATKMMPAITRITAFEMKYGTTINPMPLKNGMVAFCFLPYTKNPTPMALNITPHINVEVFIIYFFI